MLRGVRGAITVLENKEEQIVEATRKLMQQIIEANHIDAENVASVFISVTEDITDTFPAKALRLLDGWTHVPVMCTREIPVPNSLNKCIRVMIHLNTNEEQANIKHVYLEGAIGLRPDLSTS